MDTKKIGIIYCPKHLPFTTIGKQWERIATLLEEHHIEYDMVMSEKPQGVERLMQMMISNGYETIVIAGGDSALNGAVNCLMRYEKHVRNRIVLGVIPNGVMNDFALFWGFRKDNLDITIESLVEKRIRKIDVGCIRYTDNEGIQKQRYFINCLNIGLFAAIQRMKQRTRRWLWSRKLSFVVNMLLMVFLKMEYSMTYTINYVKEKHHVTTMCIGNARGYGQTPNAVPYNGMLDVTMVRSTLLMQFVEALGLFLRGQILNHKRVIPYRSHFIDIELSKGTPVSIDGHSMETPVGEFRVSVEQEELNFIIEKI